MPYRSRKALVLSARSRTARGVLAVFLLGVLAVPAVPAVAVPADKAQNRTIFFGVIPRFNPHVTYEYYQPLMDYLSRATPYRFELRLGRTYRDTVEELEKGVTDVAYLGGVTYALARHRFGARAIVRPLNSRGKSTYQCCIIVRQDSPVRTMADLKGKRMAFGPSRSTTGSLIPNYMLFAEGVTAANLKAARYLRNHEAVAGAVLKGIFDAGAVKDVVAWKYQGQGLRIIAMSEELPNAPIAAGRTLPADAEAALMKALLSLDASRPEGRAALMELGPEVRNGFVRARGEDYDFLYRKIISIPTGCGNRCHASNPFLKE